MTEGTAVIENGQYKFNDDCDLVAQTIRRVGDKWSVLLIVLLALGPRRFNDLKRAVPGISQRMLTLTLRQLERDGLVMRMVTPVMPPHVTYGLTPLGESLVSPVRSLCEWAEANTSAILDARASFDQQNAEGEQPPLPVLSFPDSYKEASH